jgi:hypothetical protein
VNNFAKFIWTCPQCSLRFKDIKWQENEPKLRKEIFCDRYKLYGDINEEELIKNNKNLNSILKGDIEINYLIHGKKKTNLYDILKKREDNFSDFKKTEINNAFFTDKYIRDNKEFLSTEGSDTKNINYINQELNSENLLTDLIKVKRNNYVQINDINKGQNNINIKKSGEKVDDDLLTTENKKLKKRYIFEKLNRRQFISINQNALNNLITESKSNKKEKKEQTKKFSNNNINGLNKINSEIMITNQKKNSNNNRKVIVKNRSNNDLNVTPLSSKLNKLNVSNVISSETNNLKTRNKDIISEMKTNNKLMNSIERDCNISTKERKNVIKSNRDKSKSPKEKNNINIKKYLFKDSNKKDSENNRAQNINRITNYSNITDNSYKLNISSNNKNCNNNNKNNNVIISYRRVNRDSTQKNNEIKSNFIKDINLISKNVQNKEIISTGITSLKYNISNNNSKNNNMINNNIKNDSPYSSISMVALKNNPNNKIPEEKLKYENTTFRNKKKNLISKYESSLEPEIDPNIPSDIVKIFSIDKMEKIPLNPAIFTNPLLANNIQQRVKHILFRGRLPLFNVDNYSIKRTLGEGTNGVIYQVMNNDTKKYYAMKKLIASSIAELDFLQKEFQICYQNPHKYVLTIYGICVRCFDATTYVLYVLMPLAEKDLEMEISERIRRKKFYKEKELIDMIKQLVEALYYLQKERKVAHRDIKPENILIFKNHVLKLADFGEAKVNNENKKKKTIRGTEFYMSPILYEGNLKSKYDIQHNPFKSDVFSLGYCFICASALDPEVINEIRQIKDQSKIKSILKKYFPKEYSDKYINLLLKMITLDENERVDFIGLDKILQDY